MKDDLQTQLLFLLNLGLLFTHEIDSAFWKEWKLFGLPGEVELFLIVNFILIVVALFGFRQIILGLRSGYIFSIIVAIIGIFTFCIHCYFIRMGNTEFTVPISKVILVLIMLTSVAQLCVTIKDIIVKN